MRLKNILKNLREKIKISKPSRNKDLSWKETKQEQDKPKLKQVSWSKTKQVIVEQKNIPKHKNILKPMGKGPLFHGTMFYTIKTVSALMFVFNVFFGIILFFGPSPDISSKIMSTAFLFNAWMSVHTYRRTRRYDVE